MTTTKHIIDAVRRTHTAVLGKTGSGKTSTEKLLVEEAVADNFRVCVLDTIKSDWWGITSSATGKSAGLPFKILGGPRGHVPLHSSAGKVIGRLVGSGQLPLSIVDMADFEPGGIQRFFVEFAESLWKNIRGVVYLVIEEAHEIAPKEMAGFGKENMAIYWAKKLATGSRTKGIRLIVATQRTQALHNAILGSCETLIAHRMTLDADQEQVRKWLKNTNKAIVAEVDQSLGSLPNGTAWVCSGEAKIFQKVHFPKFKTYDNTATPEADGPEIEVKTAPVNQDELRAIIGDAVKQAEADDPKALKAEIFALKSTIEKYKREPSLVIGELEAAEKNGYQRGERETAPVWFRRGVEAAMAESKKAVTDIAIVPFIQRELAQWKGMGEIPGPAPQLQKPAPPRAAVSNGHTRPPQVPRTDGALSGPEQKIVDAIRWWNVMSSTAPTPAQVAFVAGYSHKGGTWSTYLSRLRSAGMIEPRGDLTLTQQGLYNSHEPDAPPTREALWGAVLGMIDGPLQKIMKPLIAAYPDGMSHPALAETAGYSHAGGTWSTYLSRLRSLDLIEGRGEPKAREWLFP